MWASWFWTWLGKSVSEPGTGERQQYRHRSLSAVHPGQRQEHLHLKCAYWCFTGTRALRYAVGSLLQVMQVLEASVGKEFLISHQHFCPWGVYWHGCCSFSSMRRITVSHMRQSQTLLHRQVTACNALAKHKTMLPSFNCCTWRALQASREERHSCQIRLIPTVTLKGKESLKVQNPLL